MKHYIKIVNIDKITELKKEFGARIMYREFEFVNNKLVTIGVNPKSVLYPITWYALDFEVEEIINKALSKALKSES